MKPDNKHKHKPNELSKEDFQKYNSFRSQIELINLCTQSMVHGSGSFQKGCSNLAYNSEQAKGNVCKRMVDQ